MRAKYVSNNSFKEAGENFKNFKKNLYKNLKKLITKISTGRRRCIVSSPVMFIA
jgi:hypothetical protein